MKCYLLAACGLFTVGHAFAADTTALDTDVKKSSYAIGVTSAQSIARQGVTLDIDAFVLGARDALEKNRPRLTQTEFDGALAAASQSVNERMTASAKTNLEGGRNYLAKNKQTQGHGPASQGWRYGDSSLCRHVHRWDGIRQFTASRRSRHATFGRRDPRLARSHSTHERGLSVGNRGTVQSGVWPQRFWPNWS